MRAEEAVRYVDIVDQMCQPRGPWSGRLSELTSLNAPIIRGALATGDGAVAQLGERLVRNEEVRGSIPLSSTTVSGRPVFRIARVAVVPNLCPG